MLHPLVRGNQVMYALHHRLFVMRQYKVFFENLATVCTTHAMSGHVIVVVHIMSAPTSSRYENFSPSSFSSGVCGSSALRECWHPRRSWCPTYLLDAELLHHRFHSNLSFKLSDESLHRRLGVSKDVVHMHSHHHFHLSIIELEEHAWILF